jgi:hypothetical protein
LGLLFSLVLMGMLVFGSLAYYIENEEEDTGFYSIPQVQLILRRGIQLIHVQRYRGSTVKMALSCKILTLNEANTSVSLPNACRRSVRALS